MIGRVISGRYTVESLIGSGGMANVYKAHDNMLNRTVALKVLKEEHRGDMEFVRRFEREARAVLSLSHEKYCPLLCRWRGWGYKLYSAGIR